MTAHLGAPTSTWRAHRGGCRHGAGTGFAGESCARGRADPRPGDLGPGDRHRRRRPGRLPSHRDAADARRRPHPGPGAVRRLRGHGSRPADRQHCHGCHAGDDRATRRLGALAGTDRRELGPGRRVGHVRPGRGSGAAAEPDPQPRRRCGAAARGRDVRPVRRHRGATRPAAGLREALTARHPLRAGDPHSRGRSHRGRRARPDRRLRDARARHRRDARRRCRALRAGRATRSGAPRRGRGST